MLGGCAAVEQAAKNAGHEVKVPFTPGRTDASQEQTDVDPLPCSSRSRTGSATISKAKYAVSAEELLVDKAQLLTLTAPEMTVLVGGMRVLNANVGTVEARRLHQAAGDAHQRLLREPARHGHGVEGDSEDKDLFEGRDRKTGELKWTGTRVDLVFGSNSQLRALAEVYAMRRRASRSSCGTSWRRGTR